MQLALLPGMNFNPDKGLEKTVASGSPITPAARPTLDATDAGNGSRNLELVPWLRLWAPCGAPDPGFGNYHVINPRFFRPRNF